MQIHKIKGRYRYFHIMFMVIYAVKCDIPKKEVKEDMVGIFDELVEIEHSNPLTEENLDSSL